MRNSAALRASTRVSLAAIAIACAASAVPVLAQEGAAPADSAPNEIVVTAQKRSENLQAVPLAISVVGEATLKANNITNTESLGQVVPSLTFKRGTTNTNSTLSIRGVGTQSFSSGAEPSVSAVVDGVVMGRSGMAFSEFTNIERIEVLRGPQGTLFGKNASAGAISIVTKSPTDTIEGSVSAGLFEGGENRANVDISGPLGTGVGFTLSGVYAQYDGNIRNLYDGEKVNGFKRYGVRGKLVVEPTDTVEITLIGDYVHAKDNCCGDVLGTYVPSAQLTNLFIPQLGFQPGSKNRTINNDFTPGTRDTNAGVSAQVDLSLGDYTLTSISAYRRWTNTQYRDGDFHSVYATHVAPLDILQHDVGYLKFQQYSQEVRLASPTDRFLSFVIGGFLWHTKEYDTFSRTVSQCTASTLPVDATGFAPCAAGASTYLNTVGSAEFTTRFNNQALFGQFTANVTPEFRVIGGARWIHDKISYDFARVTNPSTGPGISAAFSNSDSTSETGWSYKAGLQYDVADDVMAYATYSRGYKGPAFNIFFNMGPLNTQRINPETSDAYEIGIKSQLLDRTLTLNLAAFYEKFDNFQANSFTTVNGSVTTNLTNAGSVRSQGIEAEIMWSPSDAFSLSGGYSFTDAEILEFYCPDSIGAANLPACRAHDGKPLPFAPRHKFNLTANWRAPLPETLPFKVNLIPTVSYQSRTNFDLDQTPLAQQSPYALVNMTIAIASHDDKYQLSLIGKNLTDKFYTSFVTPVGNGVAAGSFTRLQIPRDADRYFGVSGRVAF
ncbi:TonB-dependent receptor [Novosphingobium soli]|uniref:TonB-dependent receptor n=1 Tax=Novosphingobium soli TaxID=574956 RepID=A0ABV6D121_9SPHN